MLYAINILSRVNLNNKNNGNHVMSLQLFKHLIAKIKAFE